MTARRLLTWSMAGGLVLAIAYYQPWQYLPAYWNPRAPLQLTHPMNQVTRWKLAQLNESADNCLEVLRSAPDNFLQYLALDDYTPVENCPLSNVVRVRETGVSFSSQFTIACPLLVRWIMFEYQQLLPLALSHLDSAIEQVDHLGTFACRNVYGRETGRRSQHASASAFDIAAFRLDNGDDVSILRDWDNPEAPAKAEFLRDVRDAACGYFGTVLGPDYNAPHANHFHVDNSRFGVCR